MSIFYLVSYGIPVSFICKSDNGLADQTPPEGKERANDDLPPNGMLISI